MKERIMARKVKGKRRLTYCETGLEERQKTWAKYRREKPVRWDSPSGWMGRREVDSFGWSLWL